MPNLFVKRVFWNNETQVKPGTKVRFTAEIVNKDKAVMRDPVTVEFLVDAKPIATVTRKGSIFPGACVPIFMTEDIAWEAVKGDHTITTRIVPELSESRVGRAGHVRSANLRVADEILQPPFYAAEQGFNTLTFSDDFDSMDTIDVNATGEEGYHWYVTRPWGEPDLELEDYSIDNSVLHLHNRITAWNYGLCTLDCKRPVGYAFNKGCIEYRIRMKATGDPGYVTKIRIPAVWSFSTQTIWGGGGAVPRRKSGYNVELDFMEIWGDKYEDETDWFTITLHEKQRIEGVPDNEQPTPIVGGGGSMRGYQLGDNQWHTLATQWVDGRLLTYLDGKLIHKLDYGKDRLPWPCPWNAVEGTFSCLDEQNMGIIIGGADDYPLEIDWIRVWSAKEEPMLRKGIDE